MKYPSGPFLELAFYFSGSTGAEALMRLCEFVLISGAIFEKEVRLHVGSGFRQLPFAYITDMPIQERRNLEVRDLERLSTDDDTRLLQIYVRDAVGLVPETAEILTQLSISHESSTLDYHPVAIWVEGTDFSYPPGRLNATTKSKGIRAYERFIEIVRALRPSYGAITCEYDLECPTDLQNDSRTLAFTDFYVSEAFVGASSLDHIRRISAAGFQQNVADGLYVSCYQALNPEGIDVASRRAAEISVEVGKQIAAKGSARAKSMGSG
jgi:hypothetical protein